MPRVAVVRKSMEAVGGLSMSGNASGPRSDEHVMRDNITLPSIDYRQETLLETCRPRSINGCDMR